MWRIFSTRARVHTACVCVVYIQRVSVVCGLHTACVLCVVYIQLVCCVWSTYSLCVCVCCVHTACVLCVVYMYVLHVDVGFDVGGGSRR